MRMALGCFVLLFGMAGLRAAGKPSLTGRIVDLEGKPVPNSTVFIYSGGPRVGRSSFCPTCYPDCRKRATTDAKGEFKIQALDPDLLFRLLVVNKDFKPLFVPRTDPARGSVSVQLTPRRDNFPAHQALRGRVLTPDGKPINRAIISFEFFGGGDANCGGQCDGVDMVAVADEDGKFTVGAEKKFDWMTISIEAPGFARRKFFSLSSEQVHELKMTEGATVAGRIVKEGTPMSGIAVGLVSVDRSEKFTGNYDTFTDENGRFFFLNVPPYQMYYVYSLLDKSDGEFVAPATKVRVTGDGSSKEVGDLPLLKGSRLAGRIQLRDGKPLPEGIEVSLGRNGAWDSRPILVKADGTFESRGIPVEAYSLGVRVPGYAISMENKSLDRLNGGSLVGRIDADTFVQILMDPGDFARPDFRNMRFGPDAQPYDEPLRGAAPTEF